MLEPIAHFRLPNIIHWARLEIFFFLTRPVQVCLGCNEDDCSGLRSDIPYIHKSNSMLGYNQDSLPGPNETILIGSCYIIGSCEGNVRQIRNLTPRL